MAIFLGSAAIGLLVAAWLVPGMSVSASGFIVAVVLFALAQAILSPFILKMASRYAAAFLGGIGLVSTLVSLILASIFTDGLRIEGLGSWVWATVVVWLVTAVATMLLPLIVLRTTGPTQSDEFRRAPQSVRVTKADVASGSEELARLLLSKGSAAVDLLSR